MLKHLTSLFRTRSPASPTPSAAPPPESTARQRADELKQQGNRHLSEGDPAAAEQCYREAIAAWPAYAHGYNNLGVALRRQGQRAEARNAFAQAVALDARLAQAHFHLAEMAREDGVLPIAALHFERCLDSAPDYEEAQLGLTQVLAEQGDIPRARALIDHALESRPDSAMLHAYRGNLFKAEGALAEARAAYEHALSLDPENWPVLQNLESIYRALGDELQALQKLRRTLSPQGREARLTFGTLCAHLGAHDLAFDELGRLLNDDPNFWPAKMNLAILHRARREWNEAENWLREVVADTGDVDSELTLGFLLLLRGKLAEGFARFERRLDSKQPDYAYVSAMRRRALGAPPWDGAPLAGRTLLLWAEQGLGDTLMMLRFLPVLRERGAGKLVFCLPQALRRLVEAQDGLVDHLESTAEETGSNAADTYCGLLSLPHLLGTTFENLPAPRAYLSVPAPLRQAWAERLAALPGRKVGLVWAGNPDLRKDALRSIPLAELKPLADAGPVSFVCLQKGDAARAQIAASGFPLIDWMDECPDMLDTAALVSELDLVIAVDTSLAHLAGALGRPVWLFNRHESEWRWLLDRRDSPWYPSMRIFNQHAEHDWSGAIDEAAAALREFARG